MRVCRIFPVVRISSSFFRALRNVSAMGTTRPLATSASPRPPRKRQGRAGALVLFDRWPDVPPRAGRMWDGCLACQTPPFSCHRHCTQNYRRGQSSRCAQGETISRILAGGRVLLAGRARVCPHSRFRWSEARWSALWAGRSQAVYTQEVDRKTGKGSAVGRTGHAIIKSPA